MSQFDSNYAAREARRMVSGDPAARLAAAPSLDKAIEVDAMSTDANQAQQSQSQDQATQQAGNIDARANALADEVKAQAANQHNAPAGAQAVPNLTLPPEVVQLSKEALVVLIRFLISRLGV